MPNTFSVIIVPIHLHKISDYGSQFCYRKFLYKGHSVFSVYYKYYFGAVQAVQAAKA